MSVIRVVLRATVAAGALVATAALAHGDAEPKHGGVMNTGGEFSFEMVRRGADLIFHVEDHGVPVSTKGARGAVTVTRSSVTSSSPIIPKEPNIVIAKGVKFASNDRLAVRLELPDGAVINGRFTIK